MHFIRLLRPVNLVIIILTMYAMRLFFIGFLLEKDGKFVLHGEPMDFFLLVFSTVLIAGAGNIINDYFDVKTDRINRPERLIITRHLKRRWAIVTHWIFNLAAFGIAIYLSSKHESFVYLFIHLLSINLLWFYSMYFKRRFAIGNIIIAGLTGLVPILASIYFLNVYNLEAGDNNSWLNSLYRIGQDYFAFNPETNQIGQLILNFGFSMGIFAFFTNLAREVIKDVEDIEGDKAIRAQTIPIVMGKRKTDRVIVALLSIPLLLFTGFMIFSGWLQPIEFLIVLAPIVLAILLQLLALLQIIFQKDDKKYKIANGLLKISMLSGLFTPVYLLFL